MKNKKGPTKNRIDRGVDTKTIQTRTSRATQIDKAIPANVLYQNVPQIKEACDEVVAAGLDLADADATATAADQVAATARSVRDTKESEFDKKNSVCMVLIENHAVTPDEIQGAGYTLLIPNNNGLALLGGLTALFDAALGLVEIAIQHPAGVTRCLLEVSTDPITSWQRVPGDGMRRKLSGYAPGTYWFRAANVRAKAQSAFTQPVSVVVK